MSTASQPVPRPVASRAVLRRGLRVIWGGMKTEPKPTIVAVIGSVLWAAATVGTAWAIGFVTDEYIEPAVLQRRVEAAALWTVFGVLVAVLVVNVIGVILRRVFATVAGALNLPFPKSAHFLEHWLEPVFGETATHLELGTGTIVALLVTSTVVALVGIAAAAAVYLKRKVEPVEPEFLAEGWYIDSTITSFVGGPGTTSFDGVAAFDDDGRQGDISGDHQVACLHGIRDITICNVESRAHLHRVYIRRRRRVQRMIRHQRHGDARPSGGAEEDVLDNAGTGVGVDPDPGRWGRGVGHAVEVNRCAPAEPALGRAAVAAGGRRPRGRSFNRY